MINDPFNYITKYVQWFKSKEKVFLNQTFPTISRCQKKAILESFDLHEPRFNIM